MRYFSRIRQLIYRLRGFENATKEMLISIVAEHEESICDMVRTDQLYERGESGRHILLSDYRPYSAVTIQRKRRKGQPYNRVTLKDTGKFYAGFKVVYDDDGFRVISTDSKFKLLKKNYTPDITLLSRENYNALVNGIIKPKLKRKVKNYVRNI